MPEITRRSFLKQSGAAAATAGAVAVTPKMLRTGTAKRSRKEASLTTGAKEAKATHHLVVHVPDTRKDELRLLVGQREVVLRDRALVSRLSQAAD